MNKYLMFLIGAIVILSTGFKMGSQPPLILPRTGQLFQSTRAIEFNHGAPFLLFGVSCFPIIPECPPVGLLTPVIFIPTGLAVGVLDQCVCSPVWDIVCLPVDLTTPPGKTLPSAPYEPRGSPSIPPPPSIDPALVPSSPAKIQVQDIED